MLKKCKNVDANKNPNYEILVGAVILMSIAHFFTPEKRFQYLLTKQFFKKKAYYNYVIYR